MASRSFTSHSPKPRRNCSGSPNLTDSTSAVSRSTRCPSPPSRSGLRKSYTALLPAEIELGESLDKIVEVIERVKPAKRVVIDSLTEIRLLAREPVRYRRQIIALKNFLMKCSCTVLFIDDPAGRGPDGQLLTICHGAIPSSGWLPSTVPNAAGCRSSRWRGVEFYGGYHDYNIRKGGLVIWPRLIAAEHQREYHHDPVPSGVPELDSIFGGGPDRGTTLLAVGAAGVGKSSLCQQYCMAAAQRGVLRVVQLRRAPRHGL